MAEDNQGPFHRRVDKRFVKRVVAEQHMPKNWVRMNIVDDEVKIMEIKKYSSIYFDFERKMNQPGYELISAYNIQNAFLMGSYMLRKEQMQMQLGKGGVKEKYLFFPINSFQDIDKICRLNVGTFCFRFHRETLMAFYLNADEAMSRHEKSRPNSNPRILLYARVLLGQCFLNKGTKKQFFELENESNLPINSWTNEDRDCFLKLTQSNDEIYPESLIIYRRTGVDNDGPADAHKARLEPFLSNEIRIAYRPGKRFNPHENLFIGKGVNKPMLDKNKTKVEQKKENNENEETTQAVIEMIPMDHLSISKDNES